MKRLDAETWSRIRAILEDALDRPPVERAAALDAACAGDADLRAEVESFLRADDELSDATRGTRILQGSADAYAGLLLGDDAVAEDAREEPRKAAGQRVGAYTIVRPLGAGGMGVVYEAEQDNPKRRVALKVLRGGGAAHADERTFRREVQSLARLRHPGIAAIYEAGETADGDRFFAMELIDGDALDRAIPAGPAVTRADTRARLELFLAVCDAIGYAHQRGVLHRDLKPSNILVTREDGAPRPKVLDFGLARVTDDDASLASLQADARTIKGTLTYMSPEQARGDADDVDVRSDVYALGVILYQILTGAMPYDVRSVSLPQAVRVICEEAPRRVPALRGDLETIVLTALDKDPARRYGSVAALGDDVRRFLAGQPIQARPASTLYQLRTLAARHRVGTALTAGLALTLVLGVIGTTAGLVRARRAAAEAREQATTAERVTTFLEDLFRVSDPSEARGNNVTARELLDKGVADIRTNLADQPAVQARLLLTMGTVYRHLGLYGHARPLMQQSLDLRRRLFGEAHADVAASEFALAGLMRRQGEYDSARTLYEHALDTRVARLGPRHVDVAWAEMGLGNLLLDTGEYARARDLYRKSLPIMERALGPENRNVGILLGNLALSLHLLGENAEARPVIERVLRVHEKTLGREHPEVGADLGIYGNVLAALGETDTALTQLRRGLAIQEAALGPNHTDVAETVNSIGEVQLARKDYAAARKEFERTLPILTRALGPRDANVGIVTDNLASAQAGMGDLQGAIRSSGRALAILRETLGDTNDNTGRALEHLGQFHAEAGSLTRAIEYDMQALIVYEAAFGHTHARVAGVLQQLANAERDAQRFDAARAHYEQALAIADSTHADVAALRQDYERCLRAARTQTKGT